MGLTGHFFYLLIIVRGDGFLLRKLAFRTGLKESCWWQERQVVGGHAPQSNPPDTSSGAAYLQPWQRHQRAATLLMLGYCTGLTQSSLSPSKLGSSEKIIKL